MAPICRLTSVGSASLEARPENDYWDMAEDNCEESLDGGPRLRRQSTTAMSTLSCTRGPKGVTGLSLSAYGKEALPNASSFIATQSSPSAVRGSNFAWVRGEAVGRGSLGSVFKALDQRTGVIIAVKEVPIDYKDETDRKFKTALENEVGLCQALSHPNIVQYLGHDYLESRLYIYLEYMPGGSMAQVLSQFGPLDESLIAVYTRELLEGLTYLHTRDPPVLHRDIKGANILVGMDCHVKLSDFGCSKRTTDTKSHSMRGSIPWMAPEVIKQTGYGRMADIWSLGCVTIEMGTAKHPWGHFDNPMAAMVRIGMSEEIPPMPEDLSELCRDFIGRCVRRDPSTRPTASDLRDHEFVRDAARPGTKEHFLGTVTRGRLTLTDGFHR